MGDSYTEPASVILNVIRSVFATFDRVAYWLLMIIYMLFFNVASADIFNNETIMRFYGRVQIILGVFMMFKLSMSILKGIVNPDSFIGDKGSGRTLITRIMTALILLTILMPIPMGNPNNEYEKRINNNGLLFGTLYSLQHRILSNNTIGRLVLGTSNTSTTYMSDDDTDNLDQSTRVFVSTILKSFYRINLIPEDQRDQSYLKDGKDPALYNDNRVCTDIDDAILETYTAVDANPFEIIEMVNYTCDSEAQPSKWNKAKTKFQVLTGSTKYIFAYMPFISFIVPLVFAFILLSFTIDVAVRAIKLAVLRLLAPIPIISYMDPGSGKDSAFNSWVKSLTSTYLDLFIRLATVYFVIFIIQDMIISGISFNTNYGWLLNVFTYIAIWIGLFIFAKQAPKFIKDMIGLKGDDGKFFSGISSALGLGAAAGGAVGSGIASARASRLADETRASLGEKNIFGREINPDGGWNRMKHFVAGLAGGVSGAYTGGKAALDAKDHALKSSLDAMQKRNADVIAKGNDGSTLGGRFGSAARNFFTGEGSSGQISREIESNKGRISALEQVKKRVSGEMVKKDWTEGDLGISTDNSGNAIGKVNFKSFESSLAAARSKGDGTVSFVDVNGAAHVIDLADAEHQRGFLLKNNEDDYLVKHVNGTAKEVDSDLMGYIRHANALGGSSDFTTDSEGRVTKGSNKNISDRKSVNDAIEKFKVYNDQLSEQNAINKANDRYSGKK